VPKPKFPGVLYVRRDEDGDDVYFIANEKIDEAIENDGPTVVAAYHLQASQAYKKEVVQA